MVIQKSPALKHDIELIISRHVGKQTAIPVKLLCELLDWPEAEERTLRKHIEDLRLSQDGPPILSCADGYYMPANLEELEGMLDKQRKTLKSYGQVYARLKRNGMRYLQGETQRRLL